jgi:pyruvate/2-oxoglutarate/acetoin dehydrogenase E1 component
MSAATAAKSVNSDTYSMLEALRIALDTAMEQDRRVIVLGEDVADPEGGGVLGVTRGLSTKFGSLRVRTTPISEQAIIGAAIGASLGGYLPVAEIMLMNFTTVAMDMIVNHAAKLRFMSGGQTHVPITIRMLTGAGFGAGGQHTDYLEAWFAHTAGLKVVAPATPADAEGLMLSCIHDPDPCLFIENLQIYRTPGPRLAKGQVIPIGKAAISRPGTDVTVVAHSRMVKEAHTAAEKLANEGVSVEIIDLRTISPWDREAVLNSVAKTKRAVIVHEAVRNFGIGAEIAAVIGEELFGSLKGPVRRVGAPFCPVPYSKPLETAFVPGPEKIEAAVRSLID